MSEVNCLDCTIFFGQSLSQIEKELERTFIVTDSNVYELYKNILPLSGAYVVSAGEQSKSLDNVQKIVSKMLERGCNRTSTVVALGGGVVGDLAGFAASVFMRGVEVVQIPTTLLAMCDSSIGGKTAVNLPIAKNVIGTFHQPKRVLMCFDFLSTLPHREVLCGMGEIVKTALLDGKLFDCICGEFSLEDAVRQCASFKAQVVSDDEREGGLRKILNLGHTLGHAFEITDGFKRSHGEYVLLGIQHEMRIFDSPKGDYRKQIDSLLQKTLQGNMEFEFDAQAAVEACAYDKKNRDGKISFIVPTAKGCYAEMFLSQSQLRERL